MSDKTHEALLAFEAWWRLPDNDRTMKAIEPAMRLCIEALGAPTAADARELAIKVREYIFRATPDGSEIVGHVIALDKAAALIEAFAAARVKVALSEAAERFRVAACPLRIAAEAEHRVIVPASCAECMKTLSFNEHPVYCDEVAAIMGGDGAAR